MPATHVRKRDGRIVPFNRSKIAAAIRKAFSAIGEGDLAAAETLSEEVVRRVEKAGADGPPTVEGIQDAVEEVLMDRGYTRTAKAYVIYRHQHQEIREVRSLVDATNLLDGYLDMLDWKVQENSNMSYSLQGLNNYATSVLTAKYWLEKIYPPEIRFPHSDGDFHIHDLGALAPYCVGWDLRDLFTVGFGGVSGKVASRPPKHLRSALGHVINFFYTLQGEAAGAQAFANFDTYLAPFVRYDELDYGGVKQAIQEFVFNVNIPTRVGFQSPFTNLTFDLVPPSTLKDEAIVVGGMTRDASYGEFQQEMDLINRAFAEVMLEGDANSRPFSFPIPTYNITPGFDWDNPVTDGIFQATAKYGIPYYSNFINSDMDPEDARSMCCRLRLDNRELRMRGGGLFGANPLTGSIGVVTLNMPRIGYVSESREEFLDRTGHLMDLAKQSLEIKRKVLERFTESNLYPYTKVYLQAVHERAGAYWTNHFSTIGLIGMNEGLLNLLGVNIVSPEGKAFALEVLRFMRKRLARYQQETGNLFNLEATPAEGTSTRLAKLDVEKYPDIITAGNHTPYYTNSTHLPVGATDDLFEALNHQDDLQVCYTGGTVFHGFIGESIDDFRVCKRLVRKIAERFRLPYYTITPTFSVCPVHGYIKGKHFACPVEV